MQARLVPVDKGEPLDISKEMTLIGRSEGCDLRLEHKSVSKLHCILVKTDGLLLLRDLGSTNGTRVNGQRVRRAALLPDDQISIASMKYRVLFGNKLAESVSPDERTQQIEAEELAALLKKEDAKRDSSAEIPSEPVKANVLPDVYPEEDERRKKE